MAQLAVNAYRPRVKKRGTARKEGISEWMADRMLLTEGQVRAALSDVAEAALFYLLNRQDVEIEGLGRLVMEIDSTDSSRCASGWKVKQMAFASEEPGK